MIGWKLWCETWGTLKQVPYFAVASTDLLHLLSEMHCISYLRCASSLHQVCLQIVGKEEYLEKVWTTWENFHHVWQHLCHNFPENLFGVHVRSFTFLPCFLSGAFHYFQFLLFSFCCRSVSPVPHKNPPLVSMWKEHFLWSSTTDISAGIHS